MRVFSSLQSDVTSRVLFFSTLLGKRERWAAGADSLAAGSDQAAATGAVPRTAFLTRSERRQRVQTLI
jgi:hypothetical protein